MRDGKAARCSGTAAEMMKGSGDAGISLITELFNSLIQQKTIPKDWEMSFIMNFYKGKGDATERGNYRGLRLLEHCMKLFQRVLEQHIRAAINIEDMRFGFMPGKGIMEPIFIVHQVQEKLLVKRKDLFLIFINLKQAFDRVPRKVVKWTPLHHSHGTTLKRL